MSSVLHHGPTALSEAIELAEAKGRLLAPPFGGATLTVKVSREIVEVLAATPIGDQVGTVVIGPMDKASSEAGDALLKLLEEFDQAYIYPVLWAEDAGGVLDTIRSRCIEKWCPASPDADPDGPFMPAAESLCKAALERKTASVIEILTENKGQEADLLRASAAVLMERDNWPLGARMILWESLRGALQVRNPSPRRILAAYLV